MGACIKFKMGFLWEKKSNKNFFNEDVEDAVQAMAKKPVDLQYH